MQAGIANVKHIIAVGSGKGGVGKSTVATNLAVALNQMGKSVGLMDADIYGPSQTTIMGTMQAPKGDNGVIIPVERHGLKFISMGLMNPGGKAMVMRAPIVIRALSQFLTGVAWGELDYLIIDLPPGTGDIQLTLAQSANLTGAIIVTTPQKVATEIAKKGLEMFQAVNVPILGVVENMSGFKCTSCGDLNKPFAGTGGMDLANANDVPLLGEIPLDSAVMLSSDEGTPILVKDPNLDSSKAFTQFAKNVAQRVEAVAAATNHIEPKKINVFEGNDRVQVEWKDGRYSEYDAYSLRFYCPCASCVDENSRQRKITKQQIPLDIKFAQLKPVGRYGLNIHFSDGHNTGIYKYEKLRAGFEEGSDEITL